MKVFKNFVYIGTNNGYVILIVPTFRCARMCPHSLHSSLVYQVNNDTGDIRTVFDQSSTSSRTQMLSLCVSDCGRFIAIVDTSGLCTIAKISDGRPVAVINPQLKKRAMDVSWLFHGDPCGDHSLLLLSSPDEMVQVFWIPAALLQVNMHDVDRNNAILAEAQSATTILRCRFRIMSWRIIPEVDLLLAGDIKGNLLGFRQFHARTMASASTKDSSSNSSSQEIEPDFVYDKAHNKEKVSDIAFIRDTNGGCHGNVYTVGRDGMLLLYSLCVNNDGEADLVPLNSYRLSSAVPTAEKLHVIQSEHGGEPEIIVMGFYGSHVIVYNFTQQNRVYSYLNCWLQCSGLDRSDTMNLSSLDYKRALRWFEARVRFRIRQAACIFHQFRKGQKGARACRYNSATCG